MHHIDYSKIDMVQLQCVIAPQVLDIYQASVVDEMTKRLVTNFCHTLVTKYLTRTEYRFTTKLELNCAVSHQCSLYEMLENAYKQGLIDGQHRTKGTSWESI